MTENRDPRENPIEPTVVPLDPDNDPFGSSRPLPSPDDLGATIAERDIYGDERGGQIPKRP
jgi:hypothetical protein